MTSTTADELFDPIVEDITRNQNVVCQTIVTEAKDRLSKDVEYVGGRAIRSRPGEPARRDKGNLYEGIDGQAVAQGDVIEAAVWTPTDYAADLEDRFRLVLSDLLTPHEDQQLDAAKDGIEGA